MISKNDYFLTKNFRIAESISYKLLPSYEYRNLLPIYLEFPSAFNFKGFVKRFSR